MSLREPTNLVYLRGHQGPHPEEYHMKILERLEAALGDCDSVPGCRPKLIQELQRLARDVCTPGTQLHHLATHP